MELSENPTMSADSFGGVAVTRIAPGDQRASVDFAYYGKDSAALRFEAELTRSDGSGGMRRFPAAGGTAAAEGLVNGVDYAARIVATDASGRLRARSGARLLRAGFVPGVVVNYIHPEDYSYRSSGRSPASPSLVRLPCGALLASHDVFWGGGGQNLTKIFSSEDDGRTWHYLTDVFPCFWGKLFVHRGLLYLLGMSTEYGDLELFRSDDGGAHWSRPAILCKGGDAARGGPHKAPMPVVAHAGRLWSAVDYGCWAKGGHASGVVSVHEDADLMDPASWVVTPFLPFDRNWPGLLPADHPGLLEGNVVVAPDGGLVNFLRYNSAPSYGKAVKLRVDVDHPAAPLRFEAAVDFPGNMSKFTILRDPVTGRYYSLVNRVTSCETWQRNILTLTSSADLLHWKIERDILNYEDNGWPEDRTKVGFQYVDWIFDGDDLLALSRTAVNGAYNFHNANHITFHRIRNFRK